MCVVLSLQTAEMTAAGREAPTLNTNGPTMAAQYTIHNTLAQSHTLIHAVHKVKNCFVKHEPLNQQMHVKAVKTQETKEVYSTK